MNKLDLDKKQNKDIDEKSIEKKEYIYKRNNLYKYLIYASKFFNFASFIYKNASKYIDFNPNIIYDNIKSTIIGNDKIVKILCRIFYLHIINSLVFSPFSIKIRQNFEKNNNLSLFDDEKTFNSFITRSIKIKNNLLLAGLSGSGKTFILTELCELLDIPYILFDSNSITRKGYHGNDIETPIQNLYKKNKSIFLTSHSIVIYDEIDKLLNERQKNSNFVTSFSSEILKLLDGIEIDKQCIYDKKFNFANNFDSNNNNNNLLFAENKSRNNDLISTKNILFIFSGVFIDIFKNISNLFNNNIKNDLNNIKNNYIIDKNLFIKNNIIDIEFINRLSICIKVSKLKREELRLIIKGSSKSCLKVFQSFFLINNLKLDFDNSYIEFILDNYCNKMGIRELFNFIYKDLIINSFETINAYHDGKIIICYDELKKKLFFNFTSYENK